MTLKRLWLTSICLTGVFAITSVPEEGLTSACTVCAEISSLISSASKVYYPGELLYEKGISHYSASSTQESKCVVEAGSSADVGIILGVISKTRTPFAVKGGGHATNPGFSSTSGVHISMYRFSEINYDPIMKTVDVSAGLIWDDVYATLDPLGVGVIGVATLELALRDSYWVEYGLAVDNVVAFELVKPNGKVVTVTHGSDPDLFFGVKGGQNNFGIVTKFTLKTFPQTQVWGSTVISAKATIPNVAAATAAFQANVKDPKAAVIIAYGVAPQIQQTTVSQLLFYDGPTPPPGLFDAFLSVPAISSDISTRSFRSLVRSSAVNASVAGTRITYEGFPILQFTPAISDLLLNETLFWGAALADKSVLSIIYAAEIFLPSLYSHNPDKTAFPPVRTIPFQPCNMIYAWTSSVFDADFHDAAVASAAHIRQSAIALGQTQLAESPNYPNYAIISTPLEDMYGQNLPALRALKARIDPHNVMGLAGGWKF